eukprot:gb/GEZN01000640.1/.p1 GENE.gb/GEZN01000640.1/~~gb/GEZN01000640.1/.p1  ORF type:complete len:1179 (+),score=170.50 gb/GEZN01000640.1/:33-3539(+)
MLFLLWLHNCCASPWSSWYSADFNGAADPKAQVRSADGSYRFTVLTEGIVRLEHSTTGEFDDNPTVNILNRLLPVPEFSTSVQGKGLHLSTRLVRVEFNPAQPGEGPFDQTKIVLRTFPFTEWTSASKDSGNLHGTTRTLDRVGEAVDLTCPPVKGFVEYNAHCEEGLVSRDGWVLVDDSLRPRLLLKADGKHGNHPDEAWPWAGGPPSINIDSLRKGEGYVYTDYYFLGHGLDFKTALGDYVKLAGRIPLLPRYALGPGMSRWYAWNEHEELQHLLFDGFASHGFPIDQLSVDMDWHPSYPRGLNNKFGINVEGWTGYTVNQHLFPEMGAFLAQTKRRGIFINMNLHPAVGVEFHELAYEAMARSVGLKPSTGQTVPFEIANQSYSSSYFQHVLRPLEDAGVDFWWIDYQQTPFSSVPMLNPTFLCNFAYTTNPWRYGRLWSGLASNNAASSVRPDFGKAAVRHQLKPGRRLHNDRPYVFGRWGGLGGHRYPVGFAGDTAVKWRVLRYETYYSPTSSNVGFMWTHDIGGFEGEPPPELLVRWVQWGTFSALLRMHSSKLSPGRLPWSFPNPYLSVMRSFYRLRARMMPYLATAQRLSHDTGLQLLRPMYYNHPLADAAYSDQGLHQFWLGDSLWAAPIAAPCAKDRGSTATGTSLRAHKESLAVRSGDGSAPTKADIKRNSTLAQRNGLVPWPIWVPPGTWIEWFSWGVVRGDATPSKGGTAPADFDTGSGSFVVRNYSLSEMPVFSVPGTILPLRTLPDGVISSAELARWVVDGAEAGDGTLGAPPPVTATGVLGLASQPYHDLTLWVLPLTLDQGLADAGSLTRMARLYEDDGLSKAAEESGQFAWTDITCTWTRTSVSGSFFFSSKTQDTLICTIGVPTPGPGGLAGVPSQRALLWRFIGSLIPSSVEVDGVELERDQPAVPDAAGDHGGWLMGHNSWAYHGPSLSTWVRVVSVSTVGVHTIELKFPTGVATDDPLLSSGYARTLARALVCKDELDRGYGLIFPSDVEPLLDLSAAATSLSNAPGAEKQLEILRRIPDQLVDAIQMIGGMEGLSGAPSSRLLQQRCLGALQDAAESNPAPSLPSSDPRVFVASQPPKYGSTLSQGRGSAPGSTQQYSSTPGTDEESSEEGLQDYYPRELLYGVDVSKTKATSKTKAPSSLHGEL